ncbi:phosphonate C-P lyase system protein PhnH [Gracilibacillus xinjiangensis]|uniref:Phosphonate C-P lyase system protein PhnH n=1 Tax=Gracilibacillus xinjiangensis TaxID=1193282 RepID=A0ABV8WV98_9BACI
MNYQKQKYSSKQWMFKRGEEFMQIDPIHDMQQVYRKLLQNMARPGSVASLQSITSRMDDAKGCCRTTWLIALTLLDAEVTFHVLGDPQGDLTRKIAAHTFSQFTTIEDADFIFVLEGTSETEIIHGVSKCKIGDLRDPQLSATWIIEKQLQQNPDQWLLTGPGIKGEISLPVFLTEKFLRAREARTIEHPLGVDFIFTTKNAELICIPRTTSIKRKGETAWAMSQ